MTEETTQGTSLGMVIGGSLERGLDIRLNANSSVEDVKVGSIVAIQGNQSRFFGYVSDISLETSDTSLRAAPPDVDDPFIAQIISGTGAFGVAKVSPQLTLGSNASAILEGPQPARSIVGHFAPAFPASDSDISAIFGGEDDRHIWIGSPLDMEESRICLNLEELVKRSNGVFGKSGENS